MQSVANSGLKPRLLEYYKREIMQVGNNFMQRTFSFLLTP